jgi:putative transposase
MGIRNTPLVNGEFYHLYNRGNSKQKIFLDEEDYLRFIKLLYLCNSEYNINFRNDIVYKHIDAFDFERGDTLISIGAWVLMPNHFHLYVYTAPKQGLGARNNLNNITKFILKLCTSYSKYFNKKYERSGKLFEDKFKSVHIKNENQAKYLFSYIHLNPIKLIQGDWKEKGIKNKSESVKFLNNYKWSSYVDFIDTIRKENKIIDNVNFPLNYFSNKEVFKKEIFEWLKIDQ